MNRIVKILMFSDAFIFTGMGLFEPILAIFIKDNIQGGTLFSAGLASTLFLITKSVVQLPFARYVDKHDQKMKWLILGTLLICMVPFIFMAARTLIVVYAAQIIYGLGSAFAYPTWLGIWSAHLDAHNESFEWSMYSTLIGIGSALSAAVGAGVAEFFGFTVTLLLVEVTLLAGFFMLFFLEWKTNLEKSISVMHYNERAKRTRKH